MESAISGLVNKVFGRVFRGHVELVELARKLGREMEDHKSVSVARVYVPNEYVVYLSPADRAHYASFERSATHELADYLTQRAGHDGFTLLSAPVVSFETDDDLRAGEYGIACRVVDPPAVAAENGAGAGSGGPPYGAPFAPYEPAADLLVGDDADDEAPLLEATDDDVSGDAASDDAPDDDAPDEDAPADDDAPSLPETPAGDAEESAADVAAPPVDVPEVRSPEATPDGDVADASGDADADADDPLHGLFPLPVADAAEPLAPDDPDDEPEDPPADAPPAITPQPAGSDDAKDPGGLAVPPIPPPPAEARRPVVPPPSFGPRPPDPVVRSAAPKPKPTPPPAPPIPPAHTNDGLAGVSGTQMMPPAGRADDRFVQEEVSLIIDGRRHRLTKRTTTIGRSRDCDISVNDANASRQHAEVRHIGLDYFLVDLGSTNGTYVNQQRVRRHAIADGDRIVIGTTEMIVEHVKVDRG